jgi:ABC-type ATPase involved in cell division
MKKLITLIVILISINSFGQNLDTVTNVTLTLRSQDWAWLIGKYGAGNDSTDRAVIRSIRAQVIAANPQTWTTNVQITGLKGRHIIWMYHAFNTAGFQEIVNMGNNTAERTTIYTTIRNINNSAIQYYIGVIDGNYANQFIDTRRNGKEILLDN